MLTPPRTGAGKSGDLRSDVVAPAVRIEAAKARVNQARAAFYPSLNLMAFVGFLRLDGQGFRAGGGEAAVDAPVFDAGQRHAVLSIRRAELAAVEAAYRGILREAQGDVAHALNDLNASLAAGEHQAGVMIAKARTRDCAAERRRVGEINELEALESRRPGSKATSACSTSEPMRSSLMPLCLRPPPLWEGQERAFQSFRERRHVLSTHRFTPYDSTSFGHHCHYHRCYADAPSMRRASRQISRAVGFECRTGSSSACRRHDGAASRRRNVRACRTRLCEE
ncbi:TolC family protein [Shinella daejeonensis]|nr:TolC family protein [Shinella daejeonensis]